MQLTATAPRFTRVPSMILVAYQVDDGTCDLGDVFWSTEMGGWLARTVGERREGVYSGPLPTLAAVAAWIVANWRAPRA
jgi:hypothetical protein